MKKNVLFIGDVNVDLIMGGLAHPVQEDKEVLAETFFRTIGSSAAISAITMRNLGGQAFLCGLVGEDVNGLYMLQELDELGIDCSMVSVDKETPTGVTVNLIYGHTRSQITYPGTISKFEGPELTKNLTEFCHVHFSGIYQQKAFLPNIISTMKYLKKLGLSISLDTQWDMSEEWKYLEEMYLLLDYLFINKDEALSISRTENAPLALNYFADKGPRTMIKLGPEGVTFLENTTIRQIPAYPARVVDSIGAGDSFAGGFLYALYEKELDFSAALLFASATAARNCEFAGGIESMSTDLDIQKKILESNMFSFSELLEMSERDKEKYGTCFTPAEINQQPELWPKVVKEVQKRQIDLVEFIRRTGVFSTPQSNIIITGAGSSEYVGNSAATYLQKMLNIPVSSVSTTDFIVQPKNYLVKNYNTLIVSIGRSGDSPESLATYQKAKLINPDIWNLIITCNGGSILAAEARKDDHAFVLELPKESNDDGLAMTGSFTSLLLALFSLAYLNNLDEFAELTDLASSGAKNILDNYSDTIRDFMHISVDRVLYLGSNELKGFAQEARLKILEMTDGLLVSDFNSYIGLRHGPQVFANNNTLIIAALSGDEDIKRYELDLLKEMQAKKQGRDYLFLCQKANSEIRSLTGHIIEIYPDSEAILPDFMRVLTDVIVGQLAGVFKSLQYKLKPDSPSATGTINRVVKGVVIYPSQKCK
jgi:D-galactosamine 6-phosphate deaminase/isomerase